MMTELQGQIKAVAEARQLAQEASEAKNKALQEWQEQNKPLIEDALSKGQCVFEAEIKLRELTLQAYAETGNKTPAIGVGIRELTKLEYDPKEALKWAVQHQIALSLDKKSFEGFAKATPLEFVRVSTEPQATIATDLSQYIEV